MRRFNRIHAVCEYLRLAGDTKTWECKRCPAWEKHSPYGRTTRMCYRLALEAINIARYGHPRGKKATRKQIREWRARKAARIETCRPHAGDGVGDALRARAARGRPPHLRVVT